MTKHSTHTRWKGMAGGGVHQDDGQARRKPFSELRKFGKIRRMSRHDLGDAG